MHTDSFTLAIASGKGGTGKTLVATNVAAIEAASGSVVLADCDVEAPNAHLFLAGRRASITEVSVPLAVVDPDACTACGTCSHTCAFGAVRVLGQRAVVFDELCHGCGACSFACPSSAISEKDVRVGEVRMSETTSYPGLTLITGVMDVGQTKAPEVIRATRSEARESAAGLTIVDAPPGVSCSTVASIRGADAVLLVTEPTVFGLHDLRLAVELTFALGLPVGVLVNRSGTGATDIERYCDEWDVPVVGHLPFERSIAEAYARGELVAQTHPQVAEWLGYVATAMRTIASTPPVRIGTRETVGRPS